MWEFIDGNSLLWCEKKIMFILVICFFSFSISVSASVKHIPKRRIQLLKSLSIEITKLISNTTWMCNNSSNSKSDDNDYDNKSNSDIFNHWGMKKRMKEKKIFAIDIAIVVLDTTMKRWCGTQQQVGIIGGWLW